MSRNLAVSSSEYVEEQCRRAESSFDVTTPLKWLNDCVHTNNLVRHRRCVSLRNRERSLPRRLLNIGVVNHWPCVPKLVETSRLDSDDIDFVALSHVWGSLTGRQREALSTTSSSLQARQAGIELATIPPRYQAVVILCRCLRFQYLWIDSLCIIQDVSVDWTRESSRMASIYGSAVLTIAVNTMQDLFDTLFSSHTLILEEPPSEWVTQYEKFCSEDSANMKQVFVLHRFRKFLYEGGIIGSRAWCLQERQLSPRMLHLLDNNIMLWECSSLLANTAKPEHFPFIEAGTARKICSDDTNILAMYKRYVDDDYYTKKGDSHEHTQKHLYVWHSMLRDISSRNLTFSSDNLAAIAGIAIQIHRNTELTYFSGIWKEDLPRGLLWARIRDPDLLNDLVNRSCKRFENYQSPSWSWCSIDGPTRLIEYNNRTQEHIDVREKQGSQEVWTSLIRDVEIHELSDTTTLGPSESNCRQSYLYVKGRLGRFWFSGTNENAQESARNKLTGFYLHDIGDRANLSFLSSIERSGRRKRAKLSASDERVTGSAIFDIPEEQLNHRLVFCLVLAEAPEKHRGFGVALVLEPLAGEVGKAMYPTQEIDIINGLTSHHNFRRIGLASLQLKHTYMAAKDFGEETWLRIF